MEFCSFSKDDNDYEGYEYSLVGKLSEIRFVYLNRFIQEVSGIHKKSFMFSWVLQDKYILFYFIDLNLFYGYGSTKPWEHCQNQ